MEQYDRKMEMDPSDELSVIETDHYVKDHIDPSEGLVRIEVTLTIRRTYATEEDVYFMELDPNVTPQLMVLNLHGTGDEVRMWRALFPDK